VHKTSRRELGILFGLGLLDKDGIDALTQFFAWLEVRHLLSRHMHFFARLRIATNTGRTLGQRETAETADLDALPVGKRLGHGIENRFYGNVCVARCQLRVATGKYRNQFRLCHAD
jgi:hypothetical protein